MNGHDDIRVIEITNPEISEDSQDEDIDFAKTDKLSGCCSAEPAGEIIDGDAICSSCREHASFTCDECAESGKDECNC